MVTQEELEKMSPEEIAELQRQNCIFCKIIGGAVPSKSVLDTQHSKAILDINPAVRGHTLVIPKEHVPILPLLPPESFKTLFLDTKKVIPAVKQALHTDKVSLFIANGHAAGQQASHFMLHVLPREEGDALTSHFSLPSSDSFAKEQEKLIPALKNNLPLMMENHFKRLGKKPFPVQERLTPSSDQQEKLASFFEAYPQAQQLLASDVEQFKQLLEKVQPEVKELFKGIDLQTLSQQFQNIPQKFSAGDVFQGADPESQIKRVLEYFNQKPRAKDLLVKDTEKFKELLAGREDIQPIFDQVDIDKLAQVIDKLLEVQGK